MLVKMLVGLSGTEFCLQPGDEREFDDGEAARLIKAGFAAPVIAPKRETATRKNPKETR